MVRDKGDLMGSLAVNSDTANVHEQMLSDALLSDMRAFKVALDRHGGSGTAQPLDTPHVRVSLVTTTCLSVFSTNETPQFVSDRQTYD